MSLLVDYSYARPGAAAIAASGYAGVMRYLSPTPGKNISPAERDALRAAGLGIGLVWESSANRTAQGASAGIADCRAAEAQAAALGYPVACPIFYAVDFDAVPAHVAPYFAGVSSVASYPVGVYGSFAVVEAIPVAFRWQTVAWSHDRVSAGAHLYQRISPTVPRPISGTDENLVQVPFPLWDAQPMPSPEPRPDPPTTEDPMRTLLTIADGSWWLIDWAAGTRWRVLIGEQLDLIKRDPRVDVVVGPQPPAVLGNLRELNV